MKLTFPKFSKHPAPAAEGNPAYPSLEERDKMVAKNKKKNEAVKKIPADLIKDVPSTNERPRP